MQKTELKEALKNTGSQFVHQNTDNPRNYEQPEEIITFILVPRITTDIFHSHVS